jgi:putative ABC transport system permease protein
VAVRVLGIDALLAAPLAPALLPQAGRARTAWCSWTPTPCFANARARTLGLRDGGTWRCSPARLASLPAARGGQRRHQRPAAVVMDLAGAQAQFGLWAA